MSAPAATIERSKPLTSIAIVGALFFIFGFVLPAQRAADLVRQLAFDVSESPAFLIPSAFYIFPYFCLAPPSSVILRATGMKKAWRWSLFVMAVGGGVRQNSPPCAYPRGGRDLRDPARAQRSCRPR